uniref:Thioesterase-like superfamily-domain-containing protein n=1 Tax=Panagrellus redivivus TaxID=6233 RepID=A0A7E4URD0_PANRE
MASTQPVKATFASWLHPVRNDEVTVSYPGPHLGGPFFLTRLYGGTTIALGYLAIKELIPGIIVSRIQVTFYSPGDSSIAITYKLVRSVASAIFHLDVLQGERYIAKIHIRAVSSPSLRYQKPFNPANKPEKPISECRQITDMRMMSPHPAVEHFSNYRYNYEWALIVKPIEWDIFFGSNPKRVPIRNYATLNADIVDKNSVAKIDPVAILLLGSDFMVFQSGRNIHQNLGLTDECASGATMNFDAWIHDVEGIKVFDDFVFHNFMEVFAHNCTSMPGKVFDTDGKCLMTYHQESLITPLNDATVVIN